MPALNIRWYKGRANRTMRIAWLYRLKFSNGKIYIGCTMQSPIRRLVDHMVAKHAYNQLSPVAQAFAMSNEVSIKILAIGNPDYIRALEPIAISILGGNTDIGLNCREEWILSKISTLKRGVVYPWSVKGRKQRRDTLHHA